MKNFRALFVALYNQQKPGRRTPKDGKGKRKNQWWLYLILGLCFLPLIATAVAGAYMLGRMVAEEYRQTAFTLLTLACQGIALLFAVPSVMSVVYNCKDADVLLPLPIRSLTVFACKLSVVYVTEFYTTATAALLLLLPFGIGAHAGVGYFAMLPLATLLLPVLPMFSGALFAMPISLISQKLGKNGAVRTVLQVVLFVLLMAAWFLFVFRIGSASGEAIGDASETEQFVRLLNFKMSDIAKVVRYVHPDAMLAQATTATSFTQWIVGFALTLAENVALAGVLLAMVAPFYRHLLQRGVEGAGRRKKPESPKERDVKRRGILKTLVFSDLKRVVRDGQMGFRCFYGVVLMPMMVVIFSLLLRGNGALFENAREFQAAAPVLLMVYMSFLGSSANMLGIYPITREGKSFYLLKTLPVSFEKILTAKVVLATAVMFVADVLTAAVSVFTMSIRWYFAVALAICLLASGFGNMCVVTLTDLRNPNLKWSNFTDASKSLKNNSLWSLLAGLIWLGISGTLTVVGLVLYFAFDLGATALTAMWITLCGVGVIYAAATYRIVTTSAMEILCRDRGVKKYLQKEKKL